MTPTRYATAFLQAGAGLALLAMLAIVTLDVLGRHFLAKPLTGAIELTQYGMVVVVFAGLPVVSLQRHHITLSLLDHGLGPRARRWHRALIGVLCAGILGMQAWVLWHEAAWLKELGSVLGYLQLPTYPAAYGMAVFSALAALACMAVAFSPAAPSTALAEPATAAH